MNILGEPVTQYIKRRDGMSLSPSLSRYIGVKPHHFRRRVGNSKSFISVKVSILQSKNLEPKIVSSTKKNPRSLSV